MQLKFIVLVGPSGKQKLQQPLPCYKHSFFPDLFQFEEGKNCQNCLQEVIFQ